jgi:ABC-type Fe3+ transport system substrate-binding protein
MRVIIAYKTKTYIADAVTGFGGAYHLFEQAGALDDMRALPGFNNVPKGRRGEDGKWAAYSLQFWCTAYNKNRVKASDLPKTWDDLIGNPIWHGQKIGIANRPQLWMLMLWGAKGEKWARDYMTGLFTRVKPQFRKEGTNALVALATAGEFNLAIPSSQDRVGRAAAKGAPIGYHCPEPVPLSFGMAGIIKGSPRINAARLLVNWLLSKEGQIAQYHSSKFVPSHKDLQRPEFLPFAKAILGKKTAPRTIALMNESLSAVRKTWDGHWAKGTGLGQLRSIDVTITSVRKKGWSMTLGFKADGKGQKVKVSGRRTKITIKGERAKRSKLKAGMNCRLSYRGDGDEAKSIACK